MEFGRLHHQFAQRYGAMLAKPMMMEAMRTVPNWQNIVDLTTVITDPDLSSLLNSMYHTATNVAQETAEAAMSKKRSRPVRSKC